MRTQCKHEWKFCGTVGTKTMLGVSLLDRGCAECGTVQRFIEDGGHETLTNLVARASSDPRCVIVSEGAA